MCLSCVCLTCYLRCLHLQGHQCCVCRSSVLFFQVHSSSYEDLHDFLCSVCLLSWKGPPPSPCQPTSHWTVSLICLMYSTKEHVSVASTHLEVTALSTISLVYFSLRRNGDRKKKRNKTLNEWFYTGTCIFSLREIICTRGKKPITHLVFIKSLNS